MGESREITEAERYELWKQIISEAKKVNDLCGGKTIRIVRARE